MKSDWQLELANLVTDPQELCSILELSKEQLSLIWQNSHFSLKVPRSFVARMKKRDPADPLLLQILPQTSEIAVVPGYSNDPLQEALANPTPGILHKYRGRVLLLISGGCAVHCRYCFRRNFPYENNVMNRERWQSVLEYIAKNDSIHEVIYSGGDPLLAKDHLLAELTVQIAEITHVKRLRIHTRLPIVIPSRITPNLITGLTQTRLQTVIVLHCNHAQEIDTQLQHAVQQLRMANILVLNQAVLLKGINDSVEALVALSETLFKADILPYYLHLLDPVNGSAHFSVSEAMAKQLWLAMTEQLPGYLVPKLVMEQANAKSKIQLVPDSNANVTDQIHFHSLPKSKIPL